MWGPSADLELPRWPASSPAPRAAAWLFAIAMVGCATPPEPAPSPPTLPLVQAPRAMPVAPAACPACADHAVELAQLRQELAHRDAELRELHASQREQVKVIQQTAREAARAKVRLRRLATQAEAAAYIAEVEVALEALRATRGVPPPLAALAQAMLASTAAPFAQGDYSGAMDRTAQAEQIITIAGELGGRAGTRRNGRGEMLLQSALPLRAAVAAQLRREPRRSAPVSATLDPGSPLVARAVKGGWFRVETESGRSGWIDAAQLAVR